MKRYLTLLGALPALVLSGCLWLDPVRGSGNLVTSSFDVGSFSAIAAGYACKVLVVPDEVTSLQVTYDDNLLDYLVVQRNGDDSVLISLKPAFWYLGITFTAEVHLPSLSALNLSGASEAHVGPGFSSTQPLSVTVSGASRADIEWASYGSLAADISGASSIAMTGAVDSEYLVISGASEAHLLDCASNRASVNLSGASQCWLDIGSGLMDLAASGASTLYYRGSPSLGIVSLSGSSRLVKVTNAAGGS